MCYTATQKGFRPTFNAGKKSQCRYDARDPCDKKVCHKFKNLKIKLKLSSLKLIHINMIKNKIMPPPPNVR